MIISGGIVYAIRWFFIYKKTGQMPCLSKTMLLSCYVAKLLSLFLHFLFFLQNPQSSFNHRVWNKRYAINPLAH